MPWGYMVWSGLDSRVQVSGRLDTWQYIGILAQKLIPDMEAIYLLSHIPPTNKHIFHQHTDLKHTA